MKPNCTNPQWLGRARCSACDVRNFVLFAGLPEPELDAILEPIDNLHARSGAVLYGEGDAATHVYTVRFGVVQLRVDLPNGSQRIVRLLRGGDVIGLEALVEPTYHHSAVVLQDADLCRIPREVVARLDHSSRDVHQALLQRWQRSVDQADHFITALSTGSAEGRMARLLIMLGCGSGRAECAVPSRETMGALLGITTETASRIMADFRRRGLVHVGDRFHVECDATELARLAKL